MPTCPLATAREHVSGANLRCRKRRWCSGWCCIASRLLTITATSSRSRKRLRIKPDGFTNQSEAAHRRSPGHRAQQQPAATCGERPVRIMTIADDPPAVAHPIVAGHGTPLLVLYGSNLGTAEEVAGRSRMRASRMASRLTWRHSTIMSATCLPAAPSSSLLRRITRIRRTMPRSFAMADRNPRSASDALKGVNYSVFGCGNRDWAATLQAVPRLVDEQIAAHGAQRPCPRGEGDARGDFDGSFKPGISHCGMHSARP